MFKVLGSDISIHNFFHAGQELGQSSSVLNTIKQVGQLPINRSSTRCCLAEGHQTPQMQKKLETSDLLSFEFAKLKEHHLSKPSVSLSESQLNRNKALNCRQSEYMDQWKHR